MPWPDGHWRRPCPDSRGGLRDLVLGHRNYYAADPPGIRRCTIVPGSSQGGWIDRSRGLPGTPSARGRANFGLNAKYKNGTATGQTEFQFKPGNVNFHSTSYTYLVVTGTKAQYEGTGTINGAPGYSFMVNVIDGQPDKFRMRIWNTTTGQVIYDTQRGWEQHRSDAHHGAATSSFALVRPRMLLRSRSSSPPSR